MIFDRVLLGNGRSGFDFGCFSLFLPPFVFHEIVCLNSTFFYCLTFTLLVISYISHSIRT